MDSHSRNNIQDNQEPQTPEHEREFQRDQDRNNRLQMTSPSVRRERHGRLVIPHQPNFGMMQRDMANIQNVGMDYQLGAPFQLQNPTNNFVQGSSNWQMDALLNYPQLYSQPMAGPSRLPDLGIDRPMRDFNAELEMNFRQQHAIRVQNRDVRPLHTHTRHQSLDQHLDNLEDRTVDSVYQRHAAHHYNQSVRDHAQQQQYETTQQLQAQLHAAEIIVVQNAHAAAQQQIRANAALPPGRRIYTEPTHRHSVGRMNIICTHCGALHFLGERLSKSTRQNNYFSSCCLQGQISLPMPTLPPQPLRDLINGNDLRSKKFLDHIRQYNSAFAFTSTAVKLNEQVLNSSGPYTFVIHGELHHLMGSLLPNEGDSPCYAQLYIHDPHAALLARNANNQNLFDHSIMTDLQDMFYRVNPLVPLYKRAYDIMMEKPPEEQDQLEAHIILSPTEDRRRYNLPTADEVAAVIPGSGDNDNIDQHRDIVLRLKEGGLKRISQIHPLYAPLHYVIFFPYGEQGWHRYIDSVPGVNNRVRATHVSQRCYYAYRLHPRIVENNEVDYLFRGGRLLQQYMVDAWASVEGSNLYWIRHNQKQIRADLYQGLVDAAHANDHEDLAQQGTRIVLPSSHPGSSRQMYQLFQDSMAICREFRKPDIFLTMTANPRWPEVEEELLQLAGGDQTRKQQPADRPDIVARVFHLKKEALLKKIKSGFFGELAADVYTIEFQKRGLPHMHLLIFLKEPYKIRDAAMVNSIVSACIPNRDTQQLLYATITGSMLHGPCGPKCKADNGSCSKRFPCNFAEETTLSEDGYPVYARPNDGHTFTNARGHIFTNRDVVPYNPQLSAEFNCHINVEICASVKAVKYIHKYIYKGHDRATLQVGDVDEIKEYVDARYIGPPEAMWHIQEWAMHEELPSVYRLPVHLKNEQRVYFDPEDVVEDVLGRPSSNKTQLTEWFTANREFPELAGNILYQEFPKSFVWNKGSRKWSPRQRSMAIGRMYFVYPSAGERFYLRLLLTVAKGVQDWADLLKVNGVEYPTYQDACLARGLLENSNEWRQCLSEAADIQHGRQLRQLFAIILLFQHPADALGLWIEFRHNLCDDLHYTLTTSMNFPNPTEDQIYDYGLYLLKEILEKSGKSLSHFRLPLPIFPWAVANNSMLQQELDYNPELLNQQVAQNCARFNAEQNNAYSSVMQSVQQNLGRSFFLHSAGGCGKTFVCNTIAAAVRARHGIPCVAHVALTVASSGIAALLLVGGRTAHSRFKIPIPVHSESTCSIEKNSDLATVLAKTAIIIWDEVPMQHRHAVEAVERTLRDVVDNDHYFGGITMLFGGDFRQTLPVVPHGLRPHIVSASLCRSPLWRHITLLHLTENMRLEQAPENVQFAEWLLEVGAGTNSDSVGNVTLPQSMALQTKSVDGLMAELYPNIEVPNKPDQYFLERTILSPKNDAVDELNQEILTQFPGEETTMHSADKVDGDDSQFYTTEFLNTINISGLPLANLALKCGCPLMLLRNLDPQSGLCNGTRMVLLEIRPRVLHCRILGGDHAEKEVLIPRITLQPSSEDLPILLSRRQFPVRLAFAMTINKAQGQSVSHVGLDLRTAVFSHGQLYVALSRCTSPLRIKVLFAEGKEDMKTTNIVYQEVIPQLPN